MHTAELEKRRFRRRLSAYFIFFACGAAIFGAVFIFFSDWLKFREIKIIGVSPKLAEELLPVVMNEAKMRVGANLIGYQHMTLWLGNILHSADPRLNGSIISKNLFERILNIEVIKRTRALIWCSEICYWVDPSGLVLEKAPVAEGELVPTVYTDGSEEVVSGKTVLPIESFNSLIAILDIFKSAGLRNFRFEVNPIRRELVAERRGLASIYATLRFKPDFIEEPLKQLVKSPGLSKLSYIDFRVENRVYYH